MPFDPFGRRPGFRYIPDPLGRLGFGRYVAERELPDPFGRLPAPAKPDPEITDFRNPIAIRASVGMTGRNNRRDVARIETLLGRAGAIDLAATDGVTGYFGARTDEAVRKFQKDHGLAVDGLINPGGPTLKALVSLTQPIPRREPTPPGTIEEFPEPAPQPDPRRDTVRRIVERLLDRQRQGDDPFSIALPSSRLQTPGDSQSNTNPDSRRQKNPQVAAAPIAGVLAPLAAPALSALGRAVLGGLGANAVGSLSGDTRQDEVGRKPAGAERISPVTPPDPKLPNIPPEEPKPTKTETPATPPDVPQLPGFSMPEDRLDLVEIFPDQRDDLPQSLIVEHRGGPATQKLNAEAAELGRAINAELKGDVKHVGGATGDGGQKLKETHLRGPDTTKPLVGGSLLDIAFQSQHSRRRLLINTVDTKTSGDPSKREAEAAERIIVNKESGDILVLVPKLAPGQTINMAKLKDRLQPLFQEIQRPHDETNPWDIPQLFKRESK